MPGDPEPVVGAADICAQKLMNPTVQAAIKGSRRPSIGRQMAAATADTRGVACTKSSPDRRIGVEQRR
jgi:hypothetical protein